MLLLTFDFERLLRSDETQDFVRCALCFGSLKKLARNSSQQIPDRWEPSKFPPSGGGYLLQIPPSGEGRAPVLLCQVPNELNLELNLLILLKANLVSASWRLVLHCRPRNAPSPLRLACCARGRAVCIEVGVDPRTHSLSFSLSLSLFFSLLSHTCQHSAVCIRRRIILLY